jgi:hypothetical protein
MKRLNDYTEAELIALTTEQIAALVDLECAHQGVPLTIERPASPKDKLPQRDQYVYRIDPVTFFDEADAREVLTLINSKKRATNCYCEGARYTEQYVTEDLSTEGFSTQCYYSEDTYRRNKGTIAAASSESEAYKEQLREYQELCNKRSEIADEVYDKRSEALAKQRRLEALRVAYWRYVDLAQGNEEIAWKFLVDAHKDAEDVGRQAIAA